MRAAGWADLYGWQVDRASATPLFRQIYLQMRAAILSRHLRSGTKLPSTRELAAKLGVARASVVAAYEQLLAEGCIAGKVGSGTYISSDLPEPIDGASRRANRPAAAPRLRAVREPPNFPDAMVESEDQPFNTARTLMDARTVEIWRKLTQRAFRSFAPIHRGYSDARGLPELRQAICDYLQAARAVRCEPDQIIVTAGTQQAIDIALRVLLAPGDEVWVEDPGYPMTQAALIAAGARIRPIPVDAQGIDVLAGIRSAPKARAVFVTPSHQYPLGVVLSMGRRLELLAWAREIGAFVIEDDYHSEFRYGGRPLASLQGLDEGERVIYVGTLNKVLFPGLRMGYVVVPRSLLRAFVAARYLMDRQPPTLAQTVVTAFMREGYLAAHIRRMRLLYREQRDLLVAELARRLGGEITMAAPDQGMHLVAYLRQGLGDVNVARAARESGVISRPISRMYRDAPARHGLLLGFTGHPRQLIVPAAARLAAIIRAQPARMRRRAG
jgi:GntR family transcriptional regulator / MocR family aminotransferase